MSPASDAQALILAAGLGTRLWPLTADRAKPAVPFLGRPLVAGCAALLGQHGFARVVVNTHYRPESIARALDGQPGLPAITLSHEPEILGTAGAIRRALDHGLLDPDRALVVVNGKLFTDLDLGRLLEAHRTAGAAVTMALRTNAARERFREVRVAGGRVTGFGGLDPATDSALLFTGIHVLEPEVLAAIPPGVSDTIADLYPAFIAAGRVAAHVDDRGRWWEFSTLERYLGLHLEAARLGLGPSVSLEPGARVEPGATVEDAVLWAGARVDAGAVVRQAVLGADVHVRAGERVERAAVINLDRLVGPAESGLRWGERCVVGLAGLDSGSGRSETRPA